MRTGAPIFTNIPEGITPTETAISNLKFQSKNPSHHNNHENLRSFSIFARMENFDADIEKCLDVLRSGGTILYPTDTVWGLGCDATDAAAVDKIFEVKQRPASSSMIILLADERDILKYVAGIDLQVFDYLNSVTKPTTVIYQGAIGLADNVINKDGSIGIRLVKDDFCKHLIKRFRKPIVSTSANISGQPTPAKFADIDESIKNNVDYVVKYRQHEIAEAAASAIVKWNGVNDITIIRK